MFEGFELRRLEVNGVTINLRIGGGGPPLLLLHGYPQSHLMWHKVAPRLAEDFTVVASDLRGYGDSSKPRGGGDHGAYAKRVMADDQVAAMAALGFERFNVAGHDRGGRVAHRMALDHGDKVARLSVLDIVPTHHVFTTADQRLARRYYHWFFLIQREPFPETLIGGSPEFYIRTILDRWGGVAGETFPPEVIAEYVRCFSDPATIHATCEDYRAAATIDLEHDEADMDSKVDCPLLVLWGAKGVVAELYDVLPVWRLRASRVEGEALPCGHYLPEEAPEETYRALHAFFTG